MLLFQIKGYGMLRKYITSCSTFQSFNYRNLNPSGKLISIKLTFSLDSALELIASYAVYNPERYRYVLVIIDYISKWVQLVSLRKDSARTAAYACFDNFNSKYGALVKMISDHRCYFVLIFLRLFMLIWRSAIILQNPIGHNRIWLKE